MSLAHGGDCRVAPPRSGTPPAAKPPPWWQRLLDVLRQAIGFQPIYWARRLAEAKVRQEEAEAYRRVLEAQGTHAKALAEAELLRAKANLIDSLSGARDVPSFPALRQNAAGSLDKRNGAMGPTGLSEGCVDSTSGESLLESRDSS